MTLTNALNYIKRVIETNITAGVKVITSATFKVQPPKLQEVKGKVSVDFPKTQTVTGKVTIDNFPKVTQIEGLVHTDTAPSFNKLLKFLVDSKATLIQLLVSKGVKIANLPEFPKEIKISNLPTQEKIDLSEIKLWLEKVKDAVDKLPKEFPKQQPFPKFPEPKEVIIPRSFKIDNLESLKSDDPTAYVPVRLSDGGAFYEALQTMQQAIIRLETFADADGFSKKALVDSDRHVQVDVLTMPEINIPSPVGGATEAKQDDTITAIQNIVIPDNPTEFPLPAAQLETLTPPAAITGFATAAKQLPDNHQVTVSNQVSVDGLATHTGQDELLAEMGKKTEPTDAQLIDLLVSLRQTLLLLAYPAWLDRSANQIRSQVTGTVGISANQDLRTVLNLTNFGTFPADTMQRTTLLNAWGNTVRRTIT